MTGDAGGSEWRALLFGQPAGRAGTKSAVEDTMQRQLPRLAGTGGTAGCGAA